MKNALWWTALAAIGLTATAGSVTNSFRDTTSIQSVNAGAATAYRLKSLAGPTGQYDGRHYQAALVTRATMLRQSRAQIQSSSRVKAAAAAAPSVINWTGIGPGNVG